MHDAWFVGYTPELLTGVWVGYDSERSLGKEQTGGRVAAPIFLSFMEAALGDTPVSDFAIPDGVALVSVKGDLECFKKGTEPAARHAASETGRARPRRRTTPRPRGPPSSTASATWHPVTTSSTARSRPGRRKTTTSSRPRRATTMQHIDTRPPPRAEDYIDGRARRSATTATATTTTSIARCRIIRATAAISEPADDYRANAPPPQPRRKIVEEPLPY